MLTTRSTLAFSAGLLVAAIPMTAGAEVLVAGWDTFTAENERNSAPTVTDAFTSATMSGTGTWDDWSNAGGDGSSIDGTFGSLSTSVASASTTGSTGSGQNRNLSLGRNNKPGSLTFTLTNNSDVDRTLLGFYFDGVARLAQSADDWVLTFSGAISGTAASGELAETSLDSATPAQRDWAIDLTTLSDNVWEAGTAAIFTFSVSGGDPSANLTTNGGHETLLDNIGITASAVPEPTSLALIGLGSLCMFRRRR